mmetsp:Transcript_88271/g.263230  ORF Transcript_88271/g.263230 Transcript_88271/m.263230 type:complete len:200 (+) Transcript_88271:938-1537(+)
MHGGRRELRDGPVEGRQVLVAPVRVVEIVLDNPGVIASVAVADHVPDATDVVVDHQQEHYHLHDVGEDADVLRLYQLLEAPHDALQLEHPEHAHHAEEPQRPQQLHGAAAVLRVLFTHARHHEDPVRQDYDQVYDEPSPQIVDDDQPEVHDGHPVADKAHLERNGHVHGPEQQCEPVHYIQEIGPWRVEGLEGDCEEVE